MKKIKLNKIVLCLFVCILFNSCKTSKPKWYEDNTVNIPFREYLITTNKIDANTMMNGKLYDDYYSDFLDYKTKQQLENNPFLKVNKVYIYYNETEIQTFGIFIENNKQPITFVVYSDEGRFCLNTFDISAPFFSVIENGMVKLGKPIYIEDFGDFEIKGSFIKTRKRHKTPLKEWYDYVNGTIKNDTIHFTEKYVGKSLYKFNKRWLATTHKENFREVYQPNLKAVKYKDKYGFTYFSVTGDFSVKQNLEEDKALKLMENVKY